MTKEKVDMSLPSKLAATFLTMLSMTCPGHSYAHGNEQSSVPASMQVNGEIASSSPGISDLKFRDFFKMPIGPRGMEVSEKLLALNGKHVRIVGYMAHAESPTPGMFVLTPLPVELGDEDESLSDDLPPSVLFVHMDAKNLVVPHISGLIKVTGILSIGNQDEADGHVSIARLHLDPEIAADLARVLSSQQASQ